MVIAAFDERHSCNVYGDCHRHEEINGPLLASGLGLFFGSALASSIMIWQNDQATLTVTPLFSRGGNQGARDRGIFQAGLHGASMRVSF